MPVIMVTAGNIAIRIQTLDTHTARAIIAACPITGSANTWGDEVYFSVPVSVSREPGAKAVVQPGEIAYWPDGKAIAIGFGPTPISQGEEIRLASPCNIWGHAINDVKMLSTVKSGSSVRVETTE